MKKKGYFSDFECDMVVGASWAGLSISESVDPLKQLESEENGQTASSWARQQ